jgi:very-short-patch-repair endonuclease
MRFAPTPSEGLLWSAIRGKRLGVQFRRQAPIGRFIVDFVAEEARLVVEVDGGYHAQRARSDARRDAALRRAGYRVVRVSAELVIADLEAAVRVVAGGRMTLIRGMLCYAQDTRHHHNEHFLASAT